MTATAQARSVSATKLRAQLRDGIVSFRYFDPALADG